ncbi:uncharacterized protein LOC135713780 [Ochlerotatus camptorhynchus]|uniref:uncharacterized protein LOC135713780 n=1 Tax=Ochlerotatus camptorhynchus TaxID=644619 RepID=UPI0031DCDB1C
MSSSNLQSTVSGSDMESESGTGSLMLVPEQERSLAQRTLLYVYNRSGIVTARQLAFWEVFRERNPDVELSARDLRAMFYGEVLYEPEHFEDLDFSVEQYLNPRFNQIQLEALEFGDLAEGEDFLLNVPRNATEGGMTFEQLANYISTPLEAARNVQLAPLNVQMVAAPRPPSPPKSSGKDDELGEQFSRLLCELLYSDEEAIEKPVLELQEIRERILALTTAGIKLEDLLEPDMDCYKLLKPPKDTSVMDSPATDQMVPVAFGSSSKLSAQKRWKSWDDSGLGLTPSKRRRLMTPSLIIAKSTGTQR